MIAAIIRDFQPWTFKYSLQMKYLGPVKPPSERVFRCDLTIEKRLPHFITVDWIPVIIPLKLSILSSQQNIINCISTPKSHFVVLCPREIRTFRHIKPDNMRRVNRQNISAISVPPNLNCTSCIHYSTYLALSLASYLFDWSTLRD